MAGAGMIEQARATHDKILTTAARLFSERGYDNTSVSQVAREACVSKALVFWHFENKESLFRAALRRTLEPYFINIDDLEGLDEWHQIERLVDLFYEFVSENVYSVRFLFSLILRQDGQPNDAICHVNELYRLFRGLLPAIIERGRDSGCLRPETAPDADAALVLATLDGILIEHFMGDDSGPDPSDLIAHFKRTLRARLKS